MDNIIELLQWPAMAVTVAAAWLVASQSERKRNIGFWVFIVSNVLWIVWGLHDHAYALVFLQICLAATNVRGARKNDVNAAQCIRQH
jgi:hypothetical protein